MKTTYSPLGNVFKRFIISLVVFMGLTVSGYADSIKNLARYYNLEKHDKVLGGAYFIALIDIKYPKQKVLTYLKTKWKLTDGELKKAYKLQQTLDIPKHYTGGID